MKLTRKVGMICLMLLGGCVSSGGGSVSTEEAAQRALAASQTPLQAPEMSVAELKAFFSDNPPALDCAAFEDRLATLRTKLLTENLGGDPHGGAGQAAWLTSTANKLGKPKQALDFAQKAYRLIPSSGMSTRQAVLASNIARVYAYEGNSSAASAWNSRARERWRMAGEPWVSRPFGVANIATLDAAMAYAEGNLLAEEFHLRSVIGTVWGQRRSMKTSINAEHTIARLVANLNAQERFRDAEYTARSYLYRLKQHHNTESSYPLVMHQLAVAFLGQGQTEDGLWAADRAVNGHVKACSDPTGAPARASTRTLETAKAVNASG